MADSCAVDLLDHLYASGVRSKYQQNSNEMHISDCRIKADMKQLFVEHNSFSFNGAYGDDVSNEDVYNDTVNIINIM